MTDLILFHTTAGQYGPLSNFANYPISVDKERFSCNEQYIMYAKARLFDDTESISLIMRAQDPREMKTLGRLVKGFNQRVWDSQVNSIADKCNLAKFIQHSKLRKLLLDTGDATIAEASPTDKIWGIGVDKETGKDITKWKGTNLLGKSLMRVRSVLKANGL